MRTPDLTPAQIVALVSAGLTLAITFGLSLDPSQREAILAFVGVVLSVFVHSDAKIRHGRATGPGANADLTRKITAPSDAPTEPSS